MILKANARMYGLAPTVLSAWSDLFGWISRRSGMTLEIFTYPPPAPLEGLWQRSDLALVFMCGWPYVKADPRPLLIAAPVPAPDRYNSKPIYFTDLIVRADSAYIRLEDTYGSRLGYTVAGSHSGYNALRHHLWRQAAEGQSPTYKEIIGPLITPRGVIDALLEGRIDIGPLDSYAHDLLRHNEPELVAKLRTVATTAPAPIPPLIATAPIASEVFEALRAALSAVAEVAELSSLRKTLCLQGFAFPAPANYQVLLDREKEANSLELQKISGSI